MPERMIFCLTTGRSGTAYLAEMLALLPGVSAHHEPGPAFETRTRRALAGEDCREFWRDEKLPAIAQLAGDAPVYVETSHVFKYLAPALLAVGRMADVIVLRRPAREVALSYWRRGHIPARTEIGERYFVRPDDPLTVLSIRGWQRFSNYQLCYWYTQETEARIGHIVQAYQRRGTRVFEARLDEITTETGFRACLAALALPAPDWDVYRACREKRINALRSWLYLDPPADIEEQEAEVQTSCTMGVVPKAVDRAEKVLPPPMPSNHKFQPGGPEYSRYLWVRDQISKGSRVLDIGCNCGQFQANLAQDGWRCEQVGLDRYAPFIENCQASHKARFARFVLGDFTTMPDADLEALDRFDVVTALEVIEHNIGDPDVFLARVWRVLKPGGLFVITTPHPDGFLGRDHLVEHPRHVHIWDWDELEAWAGPILARTDLYRTDGRLYSMGAVFRRPERAP